MNNIKRQIELAKRELLVIKQYMPEMLPEYIHMRACERKRDEAERDYLLALEAWEKLGH